MEMIKPIVQEEIPDIVIGRLPVYLRTLIHLAGENGKVTTSSHELGKKLGISSAQIRKDLSHFGEFGKQGTGYHIPYLIQQLRLILQLDREWRVVLVGAGYLGHALALYNGFQYRGFRICWVFDNDPKKVGSFLGELVISNVTTLKEVVQQEGVQIGIIAVPAVAAQVTAELMVDAGIRAILNYAPINLNVPPSVHVQHSDPVLQMQHMTYYLQAPS